MEWIVKIIIALIALAHVFILYMEMFSWERLGRKVFKGALPSELFTPTRVLAANQGLYNGFLAAGLIWTFFIQDPVWRSNISIFFLACVLAAGCYGAYSASRRIFFTQGLPALLALVLVLISR